MKAEKIKNFNPWKTYLFIALKVETIKEIAAAFSLEPSTCGSALERQTIGTTHASSIRKMNMFILKNYKFCERDFLAYLENTISYFEMVKNLSEIERKKKIKNASKKAQIIISWYLMPSMKEVISKAFETRFTSNIDKRIDKLFEIEKALKGVSREARNSKINKNLQRIAEDFIFSIAKEKEIHNDLARAYKDYYTQELINYGLIDPE